MMQKHSASTFRIAGIGELVTDQIFVIRDGVTRFFGMRGGGSVWNTLAHLAQAGFETHAFATAGNDPAGLLALRDLEQSGVQIKNIRLIKGKHTRVFSHYVHEDPEACEGYPHKAFDTACPVCDRKPDKSQLTTYAHDDFYDEMSETSFDILCADHLNAETVRSANRFSNVISALDLDNYRDLTHLTFDTFSKWHQSFRILFMPQPFAHMLRQEFSFDFITRALQGSVTDLVIIGKGRDGVEIHGRTETGNMIYLECPAPDIAEVVDTAGAGDALLACILNSLMQQSGFHLHDGSIFIEPEQRDSITQAIHQTVTPVLLGIGARATLPKPGIQDRRINSLQPLQGKTVDELKEMNAGNDHCMMCGL